MDNKRWTAAEDGRLLAEFRSGRSLDRLAAMHERPKAEILSALTRLRAVVFFPDMGGYHRVERVPWYQI